MFSRSGSYHIHDLSLIVLIEISQDLGLTRLTTGRLQYHFRNRSFRLELDQRKDEAVQ
jgi:hypothetical protein